MTVRLSSRARRELFELDEHYAALGRDAASRRMHADLSKASRLIASEAVLPRISPSPYPELAELGARWIHVGRYWIAYEPDPVGYIILHVFFHQADIPSRVARDREPSW